MTLHSTLPNFERHLLCVPGLNTTYLHLLLWGLLSAVERVPVHPMNLLTKQHWKKLWENTSNIYSLSLTCILHKRQLLLNQGAEVTDSHCCVNEHSEL